MEFTGAEKNKHDFYFGPQLIKELFMIDSVEDIK